MHGEPFPVWGSHNTTLPKTRRELSLLSITWPIAGFDCIASTVAVGVYAKKLVSVSLRRPGDLECSDWIRRFVLSKVK